jgi:hypothetical protein
MVRCIALRISVALAVALTAGAVLVATGSAATATQGQPVIAGQDNSENAVTSITNGGSGDGLFAQGATGRGLNGNEGFSCTGTGFPPCAGVFGSGDHAGVAGNGLFNGVGVWGVANEEPGVLGQGEPGVEGQGDYSGSTSVGVKGTSPDPSGTGVIAEATAGGTALRVSGPAVFSRSGKSTLKAGNTTVAVKNVSLTSASLVLATLQQVQAGVYVAGVVQSVANSKFTIVLNQAPTGALKVAWFIVN